MSWIFVCAWACSLASTKMRLNAFFSDGPQNNNLSKENFCLKIEFPTKLSNALFLEKMRHFEFYDF